ncbi:MAG: hypothetical protein IKY94_14960 [Lachnospiraceae bacterium]|nr:hypothetical protein [Lachnospiraceae bacterium]
MPEPFLILITPLPSAVSIHIFVFAVTAAGAAPFVPALAITIIASVAVLLLVTVVFKVETVEEIPFITVLTKPLAAVISAFVNNYWPP